MINWALIANPINWLTVFLMVAVAFIVWHLITQQIPQLRGATTNAA